MAPRNRNPSSTAQPSSSSSPLSNVPSHNTRGQATASSSSPSSPSASGSQSKTLRSAGDLGGIVDDIWQKYVGTTPQRTKLLDVFLAFLVLVGALQFVYCVLGGNYPFNAFLAGFSATVGQFVLTASLRIQTTAENRAEFKSISDERAFADYVFGSLLLHFFCVNFIN